MIPSVLASGVSDGAARFVDRRSTARSPTTDEQWTVDRELVDSCIAYATALGSTLINTFFSDIVSSVSFVRELA